MTTMPIRDVRLFVEVVGRGYPLALMHGGPGADHWTLLPFRQLADRFTVVFYDHRCNGRSAGAPVTSMTWENLTADADALRQRLGFGKWAVLGHSFGGKVALEYALRYPESLSHLILLDAGGDSWWDQQNAPDLLARRGFSRRKVELARRWFNGQIAPWQFYPTLMRLGPAYDPHTSFFSAMRTMFAERRSKGRPEAEIFGFGQLVKGWTVMERLSQIRVPTLVMAGRDDFVFPPEHQGQLAAAIPNARLEIIERAGHNPHDERTAQVMGTVRDFLSAAVRDPADIAPESKRMPSAAGNLTGDTGDIALGAGADSHHGTRGAQGQRNGPSDTPARPGDQRDLSVKADLRQWLPRRHGPSPSLVSPVVP